MTTPPGSDGEDMVPPGDNDTVPHITPERWRHVKTIFERAIEIDPGEERRRFLAAACGNDSGVMREVLSLLEAYAESGDFLEQPLAESLSPILTTEISVLECPKCGLCLEQSASGKILRDCPSDGSALTKAFDGGAVIDGKFLVEMRLGRGGMGAVYRVRHLGLARRFALKLMLPLKGHAGLSLELFEREAKALGRLKHPNILDVTDYGVDPRGLPYLVTELLEGTTLHARCCKQGVFQPVPLDEALVILEQVAEAVDFVHSNGLLHRDLKPSNVFLADTVKLMDFGLAVLVDAKGAQPAMGTPQYMAPELVEGHPATTASDIYAFGATAFVMLTGKVPFEEQPAPPLPSSLYADLPPEVDAPLLSMLAKDPAARPATARSAIARIRAAGLAARRRSWKRKEVPRRVGIAILGAFLALLAEAGLQRVEPIEMLELRATDARFASLPTKPPDPRIVMVLVDEASLNDIPLANRADEFGSVFERIFEAGARSVSVDFLLPESWSRSRPFSDVVLRHAEQLTLGLYSDPSGETVGTECVAGILGAGLGPQRLNSLFAFINLDQETDGAIRRGRTFYPDRSGGGRLTWAASSVAKYQRKPEAVQRFWLDYSVKTAQFQRISWKDAGDQAARSPDLFRDKLVLVGGDYLASEDAHRVPVGSGRLAGITLQALTVDTILSGMPYRDGAAEAWLPAFCLLAGLLIAVALLAPRRKVLLGVAALVVLAFGVGNWYSFHRFGSVVPIAAPVAAMLVALGGGLFLRNRLPDFPPE